MDGVGETMWRALFLAIGIYLCVLGAECLVFDRAILDDGKPKESEVNQEAALYSSDFSVERKEFKPKEWMPWSMLSTGAVVILYSFTIPRRVQG